MFRITSKAIAQTALGGLVLGLAMTGASSVTAATSVSDAGAYTYVAECIPMRYTSCRTNKKCNVPIHGWLKWDASIWKRSPQDTPNPCGTTNEGVDPEKDCNHTISVKECDDADADGV